MNRINHHATHMLFELCKACKIEKLKQDLTKSYFIHNKDHNCHSITSYEPKCKKTQEPNNDSDQPGRSSHTDQT